MKLNIYYRSYKFQVLDIIIITKNQLDQFNEATLLDGWTYFFSIFTCICTFLTLF